MSQGLRLVRQLIESARGIQRSDKSEEAEKARQIESWGDLDRITVTVKIGIEPEGEYPAKNKILAAITPLQTEIPY